MAVAVALTAALSAGCASSKGKGKIAKEIRNLPNGLVADTANARHSDQTLRNVDPAEGE
jgi:outer membrane murein-binding lipoprotein Lpp